MCFRIFVNRTYQVWYENRLTLSSPCSPKSQVPFSSLYYSTQADNYTTHLAHGWRLYHNKSLLESLLLPQIYLPSQWTTDYEKPSLKIGTWIAVCLGTFYTKPDDLALNCLVTKGKSKRTNLVHIAFSATQAVAFHYKPSPWFSLFTKSISKSVAPHAFKNFIILVSCLLTSNE